MGSTLATDTKLAPTMNNDSTIVNSPRSTSFFRLATLRGLVLSAICGFPMLLTESLAAQPVRGDQLDQEVYWILKAKCAVCHDDQGEQAAGGVDDLLDLETLSEVWLDAADEDTVNDLILGDEARMPKDGDEISWNGPLSVGEKKTLQEWILRGGPGESYRADQLLEVRPTISIARMYQTIAQDLQVLSGSERDNARYLTLTNLFNNLEVSSNDLKIYRAAIVKTLNSLSSSADILGLDTSDAANRLHAVDADRTIYRFDLRHIGWKPRQWDRVASHYPYLIESRQGHFAAITTSTSSQVPVLRADWFVFSTLQPPLYHDLLQIPRKLAELEHSLGIDRVKAIRDKRVARAGMIDSKVSVNNRLIERIAMSSRSGSYHLSYDFASNNGEQNIFDSPLGPLGAFDPRQAKGDHVFRHDGGEAIFNLPNGYQGYMLVDAKGNRLDIAPQAIVQDKTMPGSVIINGISCLSCHYQGVKPERFSPKLGRLDDLRELVMDNRTRFTSREQELVGELHPKHLEFERLLESDRRRFLGALDTAGIPQRGAVEPARVLFDQFARSLSVSAMAGELGLSVQAARDELNRESESRQLLQRAKKSLLKRQLFVAEFDRLARLSGVGDTRAFKALPTPYFGDRIETFALNTAVLKKTTPSFGRTGIDLVDAENRGGKLHVEMWTEDNRLNYSDGERMRCRVRSNEDAFLTLITVDPNGEMTMLVPNQFHSTLRLTGGSSVTLPTPEMTFDFVTNPPHGRTLLKAIVTKRPLDVRSLQGESLGKQTILSLGKAESFEIDTNSSGSHTTTVLKPLLNSPIKLSNVELSQQFEDDEWATASWTIRTRKK